MSDETLKGLLEQLRWGEGSSPTPDAGSEGLWAVKWIQGGVAAGATRVAISLRGAALEIDLHGDFPSHAGKLFEKASGSYVSPGGAERHWVMAIRHLLGRQRLLRLTTRRGKAQLNIDVDGRGDFQASQERFDGGAGTLSIMVQPERKRLWSKMSNWTSEMEALDARFKYCHIPIFLGKVPLNDGTAYHDGRALMSWIEGALGDEPHFRVAGDCQQILAPHLVKSENPVIAMHRCSLMVTLSAGPSGTGLAKVWWIKDGALLGPVRIVGPTGVLHIEIVCPGDRSGELSEWAARDPWRFFPEKLVLAVARRLSGGLDSLLPELAAREGFVGQLMRQANAATGFRNLLPVDGRPCLALSGPFHASLRAFSSRDRLELAPG